MESSEFVYTAVFISLLSGWDIGCSDAPKQTKKWKVDKGGHKLTGKPRHLAEEQEGASLWGRTINWHRAFLSLKTSLHFQGFSTGEMGSDPQVNLSCTCPHFPSLSFPLCPAYFLPPSILWFNISAPTSRNDCRGLTHWDPSSQAPGPPSHFQLLVLFLWPNVRVIQTLTQNHPVGFCP